MTPDIERQRAALKMQANVLNSRAVALVVAVELIEEYRQLTRRQMDYIDALYEQQTTQPVRGSVPTEAPSAAEKDFRASAGAGCAGS